MVSDATAAAAAGSRNHDGDFVVVVWDASRILDSVAVAVVPEFPKARS